MALIKCPECGKEISDKAITCPHCGYPIKEHLEVNTKCCIDEKYYDFEEVKKLINLGKYKESFLKIREIYNMSFYNCLNIIEHIQLTDSIPDHYEIKSYSQKDEEYAYRKILSMKDDKTKTQNQIHCPTCSSINVHKISTTRKVAGALGFGLLSKTARSQFECKDCGYKW